MSHTFWLVEFLLSNFLYSVSRNLKALSVSGHYFIYS
jgi:hypothetical protein